MIRITSLLLLASVAVGWAADDRPNIQIEESKQGARLEVVGLDSDTLAQLQTLDFESLQKQGLFAVYVLGDSAANDAGRKRPMLGALMIEDGVLRFQPRFPLVPGTRYHAVFRPSLLPGRSRNEQAVQKEFELPRPPPTKPTQVTHVFPSGDRLPENLLKFYIHFSAPMSRGQAYERVRLLDDSGTPVEAPFLELGEELWDPDGKRFTLFFDPGRIKRGLKPRQELGPALVEGKQYTLFIDRDWEDAKGNRLKEPYRKSFRVASPDGVCPDPNDWIIRAPSAGQSTPLTVRFPDPLDAALLLRLLEVVDPGGKQVPGTVKVLNNEMTWHFTPKRRWEAGTYTLVVDPTLEDLAGNKIGRPFDVDLLRPSAPKPTRPATHRTFTIRTPGN